MQMTIRIIAVSFVFIISLSKSIARPLPPGASRGKSLSSAKAIVIELRAYGREHFRPGDQDVAHHLAFAIDGHAFGPCFRGFGGLNDGVQHDVDLYLHAHGEGIFGGEPHAAAANVLALALVPPDLALAAI